MVRSENYLISGLQTKKARLYYLLNLEVDTTKTIEWSNRLFAQARQSNSKGCSPADALTFHKLKDLAGVDYEKMLGGVKC